MQGTSRIVALMQALVLVLLQGDCGPSPGHRDDGGDLAVQPGVVAAVRVYGEAPELKEQVEAGTLPPAHERMPDNPLLLQPQERVGTYGGTLKLLSPRSDLRFTRIAGVEALVRWDPQWRRVIPNVAQAVEMNEDATEFVFHLRRGMRWSDGHPFTSGDVLYWYEHVLLDKALTPRPMAALSRGGRVVDVEAIDKVTVVFRFQEPNPFFLNHMASIFGTGPTRYPRHYLSPIREKELRQVQNENPHDFVARFRTFTDSAENPHLPTLNAWNLVSRGPPLIAIRNPYYWKIDTDYQQLPYIDRFEAPEIETVADIAAATDEESSPLLFADDIRGLKLPPSLLDRLRSIRLIPDSSSIVAIALNFNHSDPALRSLFQSKDFRVGLSHAIDRDRMNRDLLGGRGEPYQVAPRPESRYYNERLARQYTRFDVETAAVKLAEAGCDRFDERGFRLRPDGERLTFKIQARESDIRFLESIARDWRAVGIDVSVEDQRRLPAEPWMREVFAHEYDTYVSDGVGGLDVVFDNSYYVPANPFGSWFAPRWGHWFRDPGGAKAVEPPPAVQRQLELYSRLQRTIDPDLQRNLIMEILEAAADQFYLLGTVLKPTSELLISPRLRNVPPVMPTSLLAYPMPAPSNPQQYFLDRGREHLVGHQPGK